ncbi:ATP-binding protein [Actinomadura madurae]|uniref:Histidine kinase-like ATPase domain-containing protein n=1 Tax=Actinomadura madurae TaxID=1993 RepID=A0A1I4Z1R1_9ACTN|nr:ATP-binding protein [Actinomadura madurae]SFN44204.1 Histidine kinase-like ATPase domain-containing protein [Actinomadura madurae]
MRCVVDGAVMSGGVVVLGTLTLPGVRRSVGFARRFLRDLLPPGHPALDDLVTVGSETVCNAITHTASGKGGRVTVSLLGGGDFYLLEVADDGAGGGRPQVKGETGAEGGRGLKIVEALAEAWGFRTDGDRTIVWARFASPCGIWLGNTDRGLSECSRRLVPAAFEGGDP